MAAEDIFCHGMDLPCMALSFMVMGYLYRKINEKNNYKVLITKIIPIFIIWRILTKYGFVNTVDWPFRKFNGVSDLFLPLCGIFLIVNVSKLLSKAGYARKIFVGFGQNSMGIMCFHFVGFKLAYLLLVVFGEMKLDEIYYLTPPQTVNDWWLLVSAIAVVSSFLFWKLLNHFSVSKVLLGGGNIAKICNVPDNVENISYIAIMINEDEIWRVLVSADQEISIHLDISE